MMVMFMNAKIALLVVLKILLPVSQNKFLRAQTMASGAKKADKCLN